MEPTDFEKIKAVTDQFLGVLRLRSENSLQMLERSIRLHENGAAFYEKLVLFDVGAIALSLTLLGQLLSHSPGAHISKSAFEWFLCPGWLLLLLSIYFCSHRITGFHNANKLLLQQMSRVYGDEHLKQLNVLLTRLSGLAGHITIMAAEGANAEQSGNLKLKETLNPLIEATGRLGKEQDAELAALTSKMLENEKGTSRMARLAIVATTFGLLFMCIFTIRSVLHIAN